METFLIKAAQLILAFAILIIIHEFGHFLFARIFGIRVEKFYIFFDPWFEILKWKPKRYFGLMGKTKRNPNWKNEEELLTTPVDETGQEVSDDSSPANTINLQKEAGSQPTVSEQEKTKEKKKGSFWGETEYGIGWLPLGGYCKISGMIDESMDTEQMSQPPKEWEFRSKPAWQRLLVMIAGVLFNFLLAILIYAGIVYATGETYVDFRDAKMGMEFSPEAQKIGFQNGDIPLFADGEALVHPGEDRMKMIQAKEVKVLRGSDTVSIAIPEKFIFNLDEEAKKGTAKVNFMYYRMPAEVLQVSPGDGAEKAGLKPGDRIMAINNAPTVALDEFYTEIDKYPSQTVPMTISRKVEGRDSVFTANVSLSETAKMGIALNINPADFYKVNTVKYNIFQSIPRGIELGIDRLTSYAGSMKLIFTKEGAQSVGGFGAIGSIFPEKWDWLAFWNIAAFLSVALAFMNILPIPALDGGHVLFLIYEVITGRKPNEKFMERAQIAGMILLILLLLYANGMDIYRFFFK